MDWVRLLLVLDSEEQLVQVEALCKLCGHVM
jgi:hypothetical protein